MAWSARTTELRGGLRLALESGGRPLDVAGYFAALRDDPGFRHWYTTLLAGCEYAAYFWEHPPVTRASLGDQAEFVLLDAPALARLAGDAAAFAGVFAANPGRAIVTFPNLGGDAVLVAPRPPARGGGYPHLAAFLREAPAESADALWRACGGLVLESISNSPRWLSTSGLGVPWLHLRLDAVPKYYQHAPYRRVGASPGGPGS